MRIQLDHVVVLVGSLADAAAGFRAAGFTVTPGGRHDAIPTENALVCFAGAPTSGGSTYLELLAACDPATRDELRGLRASPRWDQHLKGASAIARRFLPVLAGPDGVADWVLRGETSLARHAAELRAAGVRASGPVRMSRERADGERLAWELLLPETGLHAFWIADLTPRERRVPGSAAATTHANGARGIAAVRVRAPSVPAAALELGDALGRVPRVERGRTVLPLAETVIEVVEGEPAGACGVVLAGVTPIPDAIAALGVTAGG